MGDTYVATVATHPLFCAVAPAAGVMLPRLGVTLASCWRHAGAKGERALCGI